MHSGHLAKLKFSKFSPQCAECSLSSVNRVYGNVILVVLFHAQVVVWSGYAYLHSHHRALISIWGKKTSRKKLDGMQRNRVVHEQVANELKKFGIWKTWHA